ncbi:hypothetical protein PM082_024167 [Marasmius tenuissimus]|nr:hypothetical protein PM082_024167 [Marasmius tenuissimus]
MAWGSRSTVPVASQLRLPSQDLSWSQLGKASPHKEFVSTRERSKTRERPQPTVRGRIFGDDTYPATSTAGYPSAEESAMEASLSPLITEGQENPVLGSWMQLPASFVKTVVPEWRRFDSCSVNNSRGIED